MTIENTWYGQRLASTGPKIPAPITPNDSYDYYIANRADLVKVVEPVAGVFELPAGAYLFRDAVQLETGERIAVDSDVMLVGQRVGCGLVGDSTAAALVTTAAGVDVEMLRMLIHNPTGPALLNNAETRAQQCRIQSDAASIALECLLGNWDGAWNVMICNGVSFAVRHWIGDYLDFGSYHQAGATCIDNRDTAELIQLNSSVVNGGQNGMRFRSTRGELNNASIACNTDATACIAVINGAQDLVITGGLLWTPVAGVDRSGIWFTTGDAGEKVQLIGTNFRTVNRGIRNTAPVVGLSFQATNVHMAADVGIGIDWPNGFIPSAGLTLSACAFLGATPFNGFTAASARVNVKGCLGAAGLLPETPIVP